MLRPRLVIPVVVVLLALAAPAYSAQSPAAAGEGVRVIVTTDGDPDAAADAAEALGGTVSWRYDIIDAFAGEVPSAAVDVLAARPDVRDIDPDRALVPLMDVSHEAIEADKVWDTGVDGDSVSVAVIDTGIDPTHPWLADAIVGCLSMIAGIESPECTDLDGHGTHVAGTVASRDDTYPGIAPGAKLVSIRTLHGPAGLSSDSIAAMEWIAENKDTIDPPIRVTNMSLGPLNPGCGDGTDPSSEAANALVATGVVVAVAAGNSGHEECTIDGAAAATDVLTVGAVDDHDTVTQDDETIYESSSGGPTSDGRLKPDVVFPGVSIFSAAAYSFDAFRFGFTGTSMATPHAAGTAALLLDDNPSLTPDAVKLRITETAYEPANGAAGDLPNNVWGHGVGNACRALLLTSCTVPYVDVATASIEAVGARSTHRGDGDDGRHEITATATVMDEDGERVPGAEVSFALAGPDGEEETGTATTNSAGVAVFQAFSSPRSHGEWEACVSGVAAAGREYVAEDNRQTCEAFAVT